LWLGQRKSPLYLKIGLCLIYNSKTQYEKHFRNWRFRKNVKRTDGEWAYILNKKHQREQLGKTSEVLLYGVKITEKTIKKRESRYTISELHRIWDPPAGDYTFGNIL